jgi:hypothetical protein
MIPPRLACLIVSTGLATSPELSPPLEPSSPPHAATKAAPANPTADVASARLRFRRRLMISDQ